MQLVVALLGILFSVGWAETVDDEWTNHWNERTKLLQLEAGLMLGGESTLEDKELDVNQTLMTLKEEEWQHGFESPGTYAANMHFFHGKKFIENSQVFKIIRKMPKGALLHTHEFGMVSYDFLFELTFTENLYVCDETHFSRGAVRFHFFDAPDNTTCTVGWDLLADLRQNPQSDIDAKINKTLSLVCPNPHEAYPNINAVWSKFQSIFIAIAPIATYKPVFDKYFYRALQELHDDHVIHVQIRTTLPNLYDLSGKIYKEGEVVRAFQEIFEKFTAENPGFMGAKIIYAPPRHVSNATMGHYIQVFEKIKKEYDDVVLGFDLVGQEDRGVPLKDFLHDLLQLKDRYNLFFHAGETDWYGSSTDENLVDAVLLGTRRIGHGYAVLKHPAVLMNVSKSNIALEVSPISNQVLKLVDDIRNHPAAVFGAWSLPMVITSDDPTFWGAHGLSYDFYMAFMGMASKNSDLRYLKKLAINSIKYSQLNKDEQMKLIQMWHEDWKHFVRIVALGGE